MRCFREGWSLENIAGWHKGQAAMGVYGGIAEGWALRYLEACKSVHYDSGSIVIFTRDAGMHSAGWWKNPDYERCWHLSLSFRDPQTGRPRGRDKEWSERWVEAFFGPLQRLIWTEPPFYPEGKRNDVYHYRVFFAEDWAVPILPRGEVYSRGWTPAHWLSYSDLQAKLGREAEQVEGLPE